MKKLTIAIALALFPSVALAQIRVVASGASGNEINLSGAYTQNFDSLTTTSTGATWTNNSTLPGWYSSSPTWSNQFTTQFYNIGSPSDKAMGASTGAFQAPFQFGMRFSNSTSFSISDFSVTYDGEQWLRASNDPQILSSLIFSYHIFDSGSGSLTATGWTLVPDLDFVSPNATPSTSSNLDGNLADNRVDDISSSIAGMDLKPEQELWIRWTSPSAGIFANNHNLAIDNLSVSFTAVPEPATIALMIGGIGLGFAAFRRRRVST